MTYALRLIMYYIIIYKIIDYANEINKNLLTAQAPRTVVTNSLHPPSARQSLCRSLFFENPAKALEKKSLSRKNIPSNMYRSYCTLRDFSEV